MKLKADKYLAKVKSYGVGKPQGKAIRPPIFVEFAIEDPATGEMTSIYYWGNMDDKKNPEAKKHPYQIAIDNLVVLGLKGSDPYAVADNKPGVLDVFSDFQLSLKNHEYNGNVSLRVDYIDKAGGGGVKETLTNQAAKAMAGFNFAGAVMASRAASGIKDKDTAQNAPSSAQPSPTETTQDDDDIPF